MWISKKKWNELEKRVADLECLMTQYMPGIMCKSITTELRLGQQKETGDAYCKKGRKRTKIPRNSDESERILRSILDELKAIHLAVDLINMAQDPITIDCINQPVKVENESVQKT